MQIELMFDRYLKDLERRANKRLLEIPDEGKEILDVDVTRGDTGWTLLIKYKTL